MLELDTALAATNDSGAGMDDVPFGLLRELPTEVKNALLRLYNGFFATGVFSDSWYVCKVVAIPKPGKDPNQHSSYRPVLFAAMCT